VAFLFPKIHEDTQMTKPKTPAPKTSTGGSADLPTPTADKAETPMRLGMQNPVTRHKDLMAQAEKVSKGLQHLRVVSSMNIMYSREDENAMTQLIGSMVQHQWRVLKDAQELEASLNETDKGE
jgi:hypothetical protein